MLELGLHSKDRMSTKDKANMPNPKVNRGCPPLTANHISADCVQISLGPPIQNIPLGVYRTGGFNAMTPVVYSHDGLSPPEMHPHGVHLDTSGSTPPALWPSDDFSPPEALSFSHNLSNSAPVLLDASNSAPNQWLPAGHKPSTNLQWNVSAASFHLKMPASTKHCTQSRHLRSLPTVYF